MREKRANKWSGVAVLNAVIYHHYCQTSPCCPFWLAHRVSALSPIGWKRNYGGTREGRKQEEALRNATEAYCVGPTYDRNVGARGRFQYFRFSFVWNYLSRPNKSTSIKSYRAPNPWVSAKLPSWMMLTQKVTCSADTAGLIERSLA